MNILQTNIAEAKQRSTLTLGLHLTSGFGFEGSSDQLEAPFRR